MKRFLVAAAVLLLSGTALLGARAQEAPEPIRLPLDECVKRAVANSRTLAAERHRLAAMDAKVKAALWKPFSGFKLNFYGSVVPDKCVNPEHADAVSDPGDVCATGGGAGGADDINDSNFWTNGWGPTLQLEIEGGIPVYGFGRMKHGKKALKAARAAREAELPRFEHKLRYQVQQAYHAVAGAREMLYTIEKGRKHLEKARKKVESDLENQEGTSTEVDLIKLKVFESEVDQYENQSLEIERVGLAALRFLVGGPDRSRLDIIDEPQRKAEVQLESLEEYKSRALKLRPELQAVRHAVEALEAKVDLKRAEFWPELLVVGGFRYGWTPGRPDINDWVLKDGYNYGPTLWLGLGLTYRLDLALDLYRLDEAKAELAAVTTDQKTALEGVMLEVEKTYHHAVAARDALDSMEKSRKLVKGWIAAEGQNHAAGLGSAKDVKDALAGYFKVMAAIHKLTHDYNVSLADLNRVTGSVSLTGD